MENEQRVENDTTIPCFNNCGAEINLQNKEVHLQTCPLALVECGWCGLRQSRNIFNEHIRLANPEKEINHEQQCMQRQCTDLSKQQNKQDDAIQRLSNDMKNLNQQDSEFNDKFQEQGDAIQRLSDNMKKLTQQRSAFSSQFQQYIT